MMHTSDNFCESLASRGASSNGAGEPLPEGLRWAVEYLSGYDMGDVRVHYASDKPAGVGARAFAHGTVIHLEAGAEDALPHEVWHVVQQKQGRVRETSQLNGAALNDDPTLEREADAMGAVASSLSWSTLWRNVRKSLKMGRIAKPVVQRILTIQASQKTYSATSTGHKVFYEELMKELGDKAYLIPAQILSEITLDLVTEGQIFWDWEGLLDEVFIRNVGYQVEAKMRELLVQNNARQKDLKTKKEQADADFRNGTGRFKVRKDYDTFIKEDCNPATNGIITYGKASYFVAYKSAWRALPMYQWIIGETNDEPLKMNCWEGVLYALYKTGLVDKTYIGWCNSKGDRSSFKGKEKEALFTLLLQQCILNMDYYFGLENPEYAANPNIKLLKKHGPAFEIPESTIIPRGRLLIFNSGEHVAISTGKLLPMQFDKARTEFPLQKRGHGMIEIDALYPEVDPSISFREGTIEDLMEQRYFYLRSLVVAPFPICKQAGTVALHGTKEEYPDLSTEISAAKDKYIEKNRPFIERQKSKYLEKKEQSQRKLQGLGTPSEDSSEYEEYKRTVSEIESAETELKRVDSTWDNKARSQQDIIKLENKSRKKVQFPDNITLNYSVNDPYKGTIKSF